MHYKNGREAREGDPVVGKDYAGKVRVGVIHTLQPGTLSCNAQMSYVLPGIVGTTCVTIGELYHAEDALNQAEQRTVMGRE